jgi:membrane fusion protein (multidrug efflux system)
MSRNTRITVTSLCAAALALQLGGCGRGEQPGGMRQMPPLPVTAIEAKASDVAVKATYAGRLRGIREVEVRARVGGILEQRLHSEGQRVRQGDPLFQIERAPYAIALQQAEAERANARAYADQAGREWQRIAALHARNAVSDRERDRAQSDNELAAARLQLAEAAVAAAQLNLDYTTVRAPVAGLTSLEHLSEGNLIERGTLLTSIVQIDPVHVRFAIPEHDDARLRAAAARDGEARPGLQAWLTLPDGRRHPQPGLIDFTDSSVDPRTGSAQARAVFANAGGELVPGQFVRIELVLQSLRQVISLPPVAVSEGAHGPQVFIVRADTTVEARAITLGPVVDGRQLVLDGLQPGERVVVNGHVALRPGMPVAMQLLNQED